MGDSLTDKRHWANRQVCWVDLLRDRIKDRYRSDVNLVNPAIGGTQLRQNVILIPRWLALPPSRTWSRCSSAVTTGTPGCAARSSPGRARTPWIACERATKGKADVLILTTNPTATRWTETAELAEACRRAARTKNCGLADTERSFHAAGREDRDRLYVNDRVHLSRAGHEVVADTVLNAINAKWLGTIREGEPPGEPRRIPARTEPRPPGIAHGHFASRIPFETSFECVGS